MWAQVKVEVPMDYPVTSTNNCSLSIAFATGYSKQSASIHDINESNVPKCLGVVWRAGTGARDENVENRGFGQIMI